jgi:serine/threonine-protein kinase
MNRAHEIAVDPTADSPEARQGLASWYAPGLSDGLGDRLLMFDNTGASSLELLRFKREFSDRPAFEDALRARIKQLERFNHPSVAAVRSLDWLRAGEELALVSNHTPGRRLSEAMREARGPSFAVELVRQLTPVLAALQRQGRDIAHGVLTPDRIIITPDGRLIITEHVLGSAIDSLDLPASRLRSEFGVAAMPVGGSRVALDNRADVVQLALIALSLLLGQSIDPHDHPVRTSALLRDFPWTGPRGTVRGLRDWLERALQFGGGTFASAQEACEALDEWHEDRILGQQPRALHAVPTPMPDFLDDFPSEVDGEFQAQQAARSAAPKAGAALASDFPSEFPGEPPSASGQLPSEPLKAATVSAPQAAAPKFAAPNPATPRPTDRPAAAPKPAPLRNQSTEAFAGPRQRGATLARWLAAGFAVLAIAEGGVIGGLVWQGLPLKAILTGRAVAPAGPAPAAATSPGVDSSKPAVGTSATPAGATPAPSGPVTPPPSNGSSSSPLELTSDPPGARVTIDGAAHGVTPQTVPLSPGPHAVTISDGTTTTKRTVTAVAGVTSTWMASFAPAAASAGWVTIKSAIELQVREAGSLLGVTSVDRLMLPAGRHTLDVSSAPLGFQTTVSFDVQPGRTAAATVPIPNGTLSLNALPWANVTLDGQALAGTTPFANLEVMIGPHEIVWKHPQLGERRETVLVTAKAPVRRVLDWKAPIK